MDPDLVHAAGERSTENHTGCPSAGESLELCVRLLASGGDPADPNLVADDLQALSALNDSPGTRCQ